jgi:hypothetical protein
MQPTQLTDPPGDADQAEHDTAAMNEKIRNEVSHWRDGRFADSAQQATDLSVAVARSIVPPKTAKIKRPKQAEAPVAADQSEAKKPFSMSYSGMSRAEYVRYMADRRVQ